MNLKTISYASSNYADDVYDVIGIPDGITLREFIEELDDFHNGMHCHSSINLYKTKHDSEHWSNCVLRIAIPMGKNTDISGLDESQLNLRICCHRATGFWGANHYFAYLYEGN